MLHLHIAIFCFSLSPQCYLLQEYYSQHPCFLGISLKIILKVCRSNLKLQCGTSLITEPSQHALPSQTAAQQLIQPTSTAIRYGADNNDALAYQINVSTYRTALNYM